MRKEELKVGMVVKANEKSNGRYIKTTLYKECVGVVTEILSDDKFILEITNSSVTSDIGKSFDVKCECFDIVEQKGINFKAKEEVAKMPEIKAGDIIITDKGNQIMVVFDNDYSGDFVGVVLNNTTVTDYFRNFRELSAELNALDLGKIERVINKENFVIEEI